MGATYIIGDIHGQYEKMIVLLQNAQFIDSRLRWTADKINLWFMGDFFDRGPDGIRVVDLVMQLQSQAAVVGGRVQGLLGNHDMLLLATYHFGQNRPALVSAFQEGRDVGVETVDFFTANWLYNGGRMPDLSALTRKHVVWLSNLPAMARVHKKLLTHADSSLYQRYGDSIDQVNLFFRQILSNGSAEDWIRVLDAFSEHGAFVKQGGDEQLGMFLKIFDCEQLIHGHTPISNITKEMATEAYVYAGGRCINVDGGLYLGGPGFVYKLS